MSDFKHFLYIGTMWTFGGHLTGGGFGLAVAGAVVLGVACWSPFYLLKHAPGGAPAMGRSEMGQATGIDIASTGL